MTDDSRLISFLKIAKAMNWRLVPAVWNSELRQALSDNLVTVEWGGVLKVNENGMRRIDGQ